MVVGKKGKNLVCGSLVNKIIYHIYTYTYLHKANLFINLLFNYCFYKDGSVFIYSLISLSNNPQIFRAHNIKSEGVSYVHLSEKYNLLYTGGFDGSFMILKTEE